MRLKNRIALVTGGGSGIGRATAEVFAREGARVAVSGRRQDRLDEVIAAIKYGGGEAIGVRGDVSNEADVERMIQDTLGLWGRIDILVNNAATVIDRGKLAESSVKGWDDAMAVNVRGVFLVCRSAIPHMIDQGGGCIINIASISGVRGQPENAAYTTSKAAVINLTKSMAVDYGAQGIRVNSVLPGLVDTEMARTRLKPGDDWDERAQKEWIPFYPIGRLGKPQDVANAVLFLASDDAGWVTGSDLVVDGGYTARL